MSGCIAKVSGKPLKAYSSKKEAREAKKYVRERYGSKTYIYLCEKCGNFHLAPKSSRIHVKHNACSCRDSNGNPKALYRFRWDAKKQMKKSQEEQKVWLRMYRCPERWGWHLTHTEKRR